MRQGVKSRRFLRLLSGGSVVRAGLRTAFAGLSVAAWVCFSPNAGAQLLLGGVGPRAPRPPPLLDESIPKGAEIITPGRPAGLAESPACSLRYAACVHRTAGVSTDDALAWVAAIDAAYGRLVDGLGLSPPLPDWDRGGSSAFDVYLAAGPRPAEASLDAIDLGVTSDRASAFCTVSGSDPDRERSATLCLGEAIALRLDAAETPFCRRALATELWLATGSPTSADARAFDDVQSHPEHGVLARDESRDAEGASLLFEYLDAAKGLGDPAGASLATYALSARDVSPAGPRFTNEPDVADVLRATFGPTPTDVARFYSDFALARAFVGSRDTESKMPSLAFLGDFGRVRFEWSIDSKTLPRRLAPASPIEPLGATYLWLSLGPDAAGKSLVFQADWEPPVAFRWALALVSKDGRLLRKLDVPFLEREKHVERVVSGPLDAAGILIVGINLGGLGPSYPFDPDFAPYEPHGYDVTLSFM